MNSIDRTLKYVDLYLMKDLSEIEDYQLPDGYKFVLFNDGDEKDWVEIEKSSGEFLSFEEGMEAFNHYYSNNYETLKKMCVFIENENNEKVATATAYFLDELIDDISGNVHWVSVKKEYQGKHLSKPLISKVLHLMKELGHKKTLLHTQTHTWLAAKIYLDMGFEPYELEKDYLGWQILKKLTNHEKLSDIKDIDSSEMYNPLYIQAYEFLKNNYDEPFDYKVWDEKGPIIGINKDDNVEYYTYTYENGELEVSLDKDGYNKLK